jgi:very-short-patch-repair endonuclease
MELSREARDLIMRQSGVVACWQAKRLGLSAEAFRNRLRRGDWQRLHHGVYATFTGKPDREAQLWGALLRAGPDAVLSHHTAAERHGLLSRPSTAIHVAVPSGHNPARGMKISGLVVHRSDSALDRRHPAMTPPCTRVEDTVLDLIKMARTADEAYDWVCKALGQRRTTAERIRAALDTRDRFPMRSEVQAALDDAGEGMLSWLERRYVRGVERPHGLPAARRQVRVRHGTGNRYLDNLYEAYRLCVELDGAAAHPAEKRWHDNRRDRANLAVSQTVTIRVGFLDLVDQAHACTTAAEIAKVLSDRGPTIGRSCGAPACPLTTSVT